MRRVRAAGASKAARVLIVGIEVPSRVADIHATVARLKQKSRHAIVTSIVPMLDRGKFANIDAAIEGASEPLHSFDWLVLTDDDISFSPDLLDDLIAIASAADLALVQPSHAFVSHATYRITQRRYGTLARRTNFVEIGPLTLVRADLFDAVVPSPPSRWCYGIDLLWSAAARCAGLRIGIIDASPVRHLRPVAGGYDMDAARAEGQALIRNHNVTENRADLFGRNETVLAA